MRWCSWRVRSAWSWRRSARSSPGDEGIAWRAAYGWSADALAHAPTSAADAGSLAGYALLAGEPVVSDDVRTDRRFGTSQLFAEKHPVSAVAVVIPGDRRPFGVLFAAARERRSFTPEDVDFMKAVANVVGVAVERSRVAERMEEVRANLRARIARDLHDDALRELADALALAATARSMVVAEEEAARWDGLIGALGRVGQHLRGAVYDLRLTDDEHRGFAALLSDLVDVQSGQAIGCRVELSGRGAIPAGSLGHRGTEVLRIVREAITNARVHSGCHDDPRGRRGVNARAAADRGKRRWGVAGSGGPCAGPTRERDRRDVRAGR